MTQSQTLIQADIPANGHSQLSQQAAQARAAARQSQAPLDLTTPRGEATTENARNFSGRYLRLAARICLELDPEPIDQMVDGLVQLRTENGRLFILGVGGSAANAQHAVNDFRKLCNIEAYAPTDNAAELTARANDDGWESVFADWLKTSRVGEHDAVMVFSVGGGNPERNVSMNIVRALEFARLRGCAIYAILGRNDGFAAQVADAAITVPMVDAGLVTPLSESFQAIIWHALVSHPALQKQPTKW